MLNLSFARDFILHHLQAKTRHGTHSPFVYRLVDEVIYDFDNKKVYEKVENLRNDLLSDKRVINVTDLGAGSLLNNSKKKLVRDIAKNTLKPARLAQLLFRLVSDLKPAYMIELGTCLGTTSVYLKFASPEAQFYTLEGCPETAEIAAEVIQKAGATGIRQIVGNFDDMLPAVIEKMEKLDFVFVDGNHQKGATLRYFEWCLPKVHDGTLLIFDDIYWSDGMKEAWATIKAHPQVTVTIDMFWVGLVYFRKGQVKEDFRIRY